MTLDTTKLYFHPSVSGDLARLTANLPQSLIISGEAGIGLITFMQAIARAFSVRPLIYLPEKEGKVDIEKGTISVSVIEKIENDVRTKAAGRRLIVIDYADRMKPTAQNKFLKLFEEPGENTYYLLLTHEPARLLPTIRSRAQHHELRPITREQSEMLLDDLNVHDPSKRAQLLFIATGLPAELTRLATDEKYFAGRSDIVRDARTLIQGTPYQKLLLTGKYRENRTGAILLLKDAGRLLGDSLAQNQAQRSVELLDNLLESITRLEGNGNIRLVLAALAA